jgi:hypothetical protein
MVEVVGSNPAVPTNPFNNLHVLCGEVIAPGCSASILSH